ncbi:PaaI family thioesterase [Enterovirga rhinocerotis]|uniref:Uncharacterized protein (TIGR00369 family) n=1 Tax=Enterovirga rhinocerotis TaxID=1339210 RepID=A0A4R7BV27_9HYPH|nr:PaaI family thioesterase [Enterovirga rhinocerotis]TDR89688.1 uncharacterized protein (TIGR00369 family) [Enterovirga rhinocerotis]
MKAGTEAGLVARETVLGESGLELLRGILDGRHPPPPFALTTQCVLDEVEEGRVVFRGTPTAAFLNPLGSVHGGWTAGIMDSAMACAVHSTLKAGQGYTTLEFRVHLVRAVLPSSGELVCEGRIVHRGGQVATSEGYLRDAGGRLYAHGTETCLIFDAAARAARG